MISDRQSEELLALELALDRLGEMSPGSGKWWNCVTSAGCRGGNSRGTQRVADNRKRDWLAAKAWLKGQIRRQSPEEIRQ